MESNRRFLHFFDQDEYEKEVPESDEKKNKPFPLFQKPYDETKSLIDLIQLPSQNQYILRFNFKFFFKHHKFFLVRLVPLYGYCLGHCNDSNNSS